MRKIFLLMVVTLVANVCVAQLNVVGTIEKRKTELTLGFRGYLFSMGERYFIGVSSSNRYDGYTIIDLGCDVESSLESAKQLITLFESMKVGETTIIKNQANENVTLRKVNNLGYKCFKVDCVGQAGDAWLEPKHINKIIKRLEKKLKGEVESESEEEE